MLGNMKFISRVEQDITKTLKNNSIFARNHVIFSTYSITPILVHRIYNT